MSRAEIGAAQRALEPGHPGDDGQLLLVGIEHRFTRSWQDVTTWRARIEGNPVRLAQ